MRHALSTAIVAVALALTAGVFLFALPQYRPGYVHHDYDMASRTHFTLQQVRRAFAAHGFRLRDGDLWAPGTPGTWLRPLESPSGLEVNVYGPTTRLGWNASRDVTYERLLGNVSVTYGGDDEGVVARAKAALADLG